MKADSKETADIAMEDDGRPSSHVIAAPFGLNFYKYLCKLFPILGISFYGNDITGKMEIIDLYIRPPSLLRIPILDNQLSSETIEKVNDHISECGFWMMPMARSTDNTIVLTWYSITERPLSHSFREKVYWKDNP